ncbi:jmjC domain-containing histone demethylation protein 1-like [Amphibalanus amphitrite]|uniref:jmjC domain-containing histone demethylation protein 1-like n=1 Tax=Amphibalanus amphitrite TaxID=1232801 RepID=UPI001C910F54|nr:jmjC domain-containing histone demethylation protein 1-like [Amphibalanus amphitrite]
MTGDSNSGEDSDNSPKKSRKMRRIKTREKDRKIYTDDWNLAEEELEGHRLFDIDEKMVSDNFPQCFVKEMKGEEFDLAWVQANGFSTPLVFHSTEGLGINVPPSTFTINDVRLAVGSRRMLDVMDVRTQKNMEMTMKEWQQYFENPDKDRLLNVISLEFSHTKLDRLVEAPTVVRQIDWVDRVWPRHLKELQTESTNVLDDMMYPKVQKYCLMSVNGCYTDFHIDFGGTSVWYHVLKGGKIFWLIPPTDQNVQLYEDWVLSGKQGDVFFGDTVERCGRIELRPGDTFFIPTGWIHAVYTPADSLVFGGNFLHSFAVEKQLKIARVEDATRVQQKYRYPFFTEMLWYVLERYVHCLLGRSHLVLGLDELAEPAPSPHKPAPPHVHLTPFELHGLKAIVLYLHSQPASRKCVPELIRDPIGLIGDVRQLVEQHRFDCPKLAVTGRPALQWPDNGQELRLMLQGYVKTAEEEFDPDASPKKGPRGPRGTPITKKPLLKTKKGDRRRRVRCKECEGCTRDECRECACCRDMPKFGGPGIIKQSCKRRVCQKPQLPVTAVCCYCSLTGWGRPLSPVAGKRNRPEQKSTLYECRSCFRIAHIACTTRQLNTETEGRVLSALPNCWTCPECVDMGLEEAPPVLPPALLPPGVKRKPGRPPGRPKKARSDEPVGVPASQVVSAQERLWVPPGAENTLPAVKAEPKKEEPQPASPAEAQTAEGAERASGADSPAPPTLEPQEPLTAPLSLDSVDERQRPELSPEGAPPPDPGQVSAGPAEPAEPPAPALVHPEKDGGTRIPTLRNLSEYVQARSRRQLRRPLYPVRPLSPPQPAAAAEPALHREALVAVFQRLGPADRAACLLVCRAWSSAALDRRLWQQLSAAHRRIGEHELVFIMRRQPAELELSWAQLGGDQLAWLVGRLGHLRHLRLQGLPFATVAALRTPCCALLHTLDLAHCEGLTDARLRELLSPPSEARPGCTDASSRLRRLRRLSVAGTDVSDAGCRELAQRLPELTELDVSGCLRLADAGLEALAGPDAPPLERLDISGCRALTAEVLPLLRRCAKLRSVTARHCPAISAEAARQFSEQTGVELQV